MRERRRREGRIEKREMKEGRREEETGESVYVLGT